MIKSFSNSEFYQNTKLSFRLDYLSPLVIDNQARRISKLLNVNVAYNRKQRVQDGDNDNYVKIYPNVQGGNNMVSIETKPEPYFNAINTLNKLLGFIREKGYTNHSCTIEIKIHIDTKDLEGYGMIEGMNKLKFVLGLDEDKYFKYWQKDNREVNKQMVDFVVPKKLFFNFDMRYISPNDFDVPSSKYFGLDFTDLNKGYYTVNYLGGKGYENKADAIVDGLTYLLDRSEEVLKNPKVYTTSELGILKKSLIKHQEKIINIISYDSFIKKFPGIRLFIDLRDEPRKIELHYNKFRELLFKLIIHGNLKRGLINLDTAKDVFQMKESNIFYIINIKDLEIYDSIISGDFVNCFFENCQIRASKIVKSKINNKNKVSNTNIYQTTFAGDNNLLTKCYIDDCGIVDAEFRDCIIVNSQVPYKAKLDANTKVIET